MFLLAVWLPALREVAGAGDAWRRASEAFARRLRRIGAVTVGAGAAAALLGLGLQGASAGGTSFWDALDTDVIGDVLGTRAGTVWGLRLLDWVLLGVLLGAVSARRALPALQPASLGAVGQALPRTAGLGVLAPLALLLGFLVLSPALAGHAGVSDPTIVLFPAERRARARDECLDRRPRPILLALPAATGSLDPPDRTRLLSASLWRFSPLALLSVAALLATGILQSVFHLTAVADLMGHGIRPRDPRQELPARPSNRPRGAQPPPLAAPPPPARRRGWLAWPRGAAAAAHVAHRGRRCWPSCSV